MNRGRGLGPGTLRKRGRKWFLDYTDENGRRRREFLSAGKREAQELQAEIIARRNRRLRGLEVVHEDIGLDELRDRYLADLCARATEMHVRNVELVLGRILDVMPARTVGELTPAEVIAYRTRLLRDGGSNRNANYHVQCLHGMLRWGVEVGLVASDPLARLRKLPDGPKHQRQRRRAMTEPEIERFLTAAEEEDAALRSTVRRISQASMWQTLLETGIRYGEMRQLTWADLDAAGAALHLRAETTKAGRDRMIPLRRPLVRRLAALRQEQWRALGRRPGRGDRLFLTPRGCPWCRPSNNLRRCFERLLLAARIDRVDAQGRKLDIHALRHSFISRLARNGVPLIQAQRLAGHSDPKLTAQVYSHLGTEDLRAAIEGLVPAREETAARQAGTA